MARRGLILCWSLVLLYCGAPPSAHGQGVDFAVLARRLAPVGTADRRVSILCCSVLPPGGDHWSMALDDESQDLLFMRERFSPTHSLYARVTSFWGEDAPTTPAELQVALKAVLEHSTGTRFSDLAATVEIDTSRAPLWAWFRWSVQDLGVRGHEGEKFTMTTRGIYFVHPDVPGLQCLALISDRIGPSDPSPNLDAMDAFLASLQITRADGRVVRSFPVGRDPVGLLYAHRSLWVTCDAAGHAGRNRGEIVRFDPVDMKVITRIPTKSKAIGVAATDQAVWATLPDEHKLIKIDAATNAVVQTVSCGKRPTMLTCADGALFVTDRPGRAVWKLDGNTGTPLGRPNRDLVDPNSVLFADSLLWVMDVVGNRLYALDPATLETRGDPVPLGLGVWDIKAGAGAIWAKCYSSKSIERVDPATRRVVATIPTPGPWASGVVFVKDALWVGDYTDGSLGRLDPATNRFVDPPAHVGVRAGNITGTGDAIWINDRATGELHRFALP